MGFYNKSLYTKKYYKLNWWAHMATYNQNYYNKLPDLFNRTIKPIDYIYHMSYTHTANFKPVGYMWYFGIRCETMANVPGGKKTKKRKHNLFTYEASKSSPLRSLIQRCLCVPGQIGIWKCWFCWGWTQNPEKNSWSRDENQQQAQPIYGINAGNRTWTTLVGGDYSHQYTIPSP